MEHTNMSECIHALCSGPAWAQEGPSTHYIKKDKYREVQCTLSCITFYGIFEIKVKSPTACCVTRQGQTCDALRSLDTSQTLSPASTVTVRNPQPN